VSAVFFSKRAIRKPVTSADDLLAREGMTEKHSEGAGYPDSLIQFGKHDEIG
jgi:hypothetical protein